MAIEVCYCGLIKQGKAGVTVREGVRVCNSCGRVADLSDLPAAEAAGDVFRPIPTSRITTLPGVPGCWITAVLGVVTELTSASGRTAATKGNIALDAGLAGLNRTAKAMGANAVVGLVASTFGARRSHGGVRRRCGGRTADGYCGRRRGRTVDQPGAVSLS